MGYPWSVKPPDDEDDMPVHYWVSLTPQEKNMILDALRSHNTTSTALKKAAEQAIQLGVQLPGTAKPMIDWDKAEEKAASRGSSVADWIAEEPR